MNIHIHDKPAYIVYVQGGPKNISTCFCQNFVKSLPNFDNF